MFYIIRSEERPDGWVSLSFSNDWIPWLAKNIPKSVDSDVKNRLRSNLKHLLVGLEIKAALIDSHEKRQPGQPGVLFEPYFQGLIQEFCVGVFSVLEGLGAAHWLDQNEVDGAAGPKIWRDQWSPALSLVYDADGTRGLADLIGIIAGLRNRVHQDRLGMRDAIDWHAFSYEGAFMPSRRAMRIVLSRDGNDVPERSNLNDDE